MTVDVEAPKRRAAQSRATATRQQIVDSAIELFSERGYGDTGLNDITARTGVTSGAFYYHFKSKEDVAAAIAAQGWSKMRNLVAACLNAPGPGLERVISMSFSLSELIARNTTVAVTVHLDQAVTQFSPAGRLSRSRLLCVFVDAVADALRAHLRGGVDARAVAWMVWIILTGCHHLAQTTAGHAADRLAGCWLMLLPALVDNENLPYFKTFVARRTAQFAAARPQS